MNRPRTTLLLTAAVVAACAATNGRIEPASVAIAPVSAEPTSSPPLASATPSASTDAGAAEPPARPPSFAEARPDGRWVLQPAGMVMSATAHLPLERADSDASGVRCGAGACRRRDICCNDGIDPFCVPTPGKLHGVQGVGDASTACTDAVDAASRGKVAGARGCDDTSD